MCGIGAVICGDHEQKEQLCSIIMKVITRRGPDVQDKHQCSDTKSIKSSSNVEMSPMLLGAVLHLRGADGHPTKQPLICPISGNALCWNGEVFGGKLLVCNGSNDTIEVLSMLSDVSDRSIEKNTKCPMDTSSRFQNSLASLVADDIRIAMLGVEGPYAFMFWCASINTFFYARDPMGRRSLLTANIGEDNDSFVLSSVAPRNPEHEWQQVSSTHLYYVTYDPIHNHDQTIRSKPCFNKIPWIGHNINKSLNLKPNLAYMAGVIEHQPEFVSKSLNCTNNSNDNIMQFEEAVELFLNALDLAVRRHVVNIPSNQLLTSSNGAECIEESSHAEVAVLFSGGIDSVVIACLAHKHIDPNVSIELVNVCFHGDKSNKEQESLKRSKKHKGAELVEEELAPDRVAAIAALKELQQLYPQRKWILVCVDVSWEEVLEYRQHIASLSYPSNTNMDVNIALALWFASRGIGKVAHVSCQSTIGIINDDDNVHHNLRYSDATNNNQNKQASEDVDVKADGSSKTNSSLTNEHISCHKVGCLGVAKKNCRFSACGLCCRRTSKLISQLMISKNENKKTTNKMNTTSTPVLSDAQERKRARKEFKLDNDSIFQQLQREGLCGDNLQCIDDLGSLFTSDCSKCPSHHSSVISFPSPPSPSSPSPSSSSSSSSSSLMSKDVLCKQDYHLKTRVLLSGCGADELMGGYARYRGVWQRGGNDGLREELDDEMFRMQTRNLGRDDRVVSDLGRELRCPFLEENVILALRLKIPSIDLLCDLSQEAGRGDKKILREVARRLGLNTSQGGCASLVKRAIQFGSRIAKLSNKEEHGCNRKGKGKDEYKRP